MISEPKALGSRSLLLLLYSRMHLLHLQLVVVGIYCPLFHALWLQLELFISLAAAKTYFGIYWTLGSSIAGMPYCCSIASLFLRDYPRLTYFLQHQHALTVRCPFPPIIIMCHRILACHLPLLVFTTAFPSVPFRERRPLYSW